MLINNIELEILSRIMALSIFDEKENIPEIQDLKKVLRSSYSIWGEIKDYVYEKYPQAIEKWNFAGKNYGWSFSLKDKKRAIIYLTPSNGYFMVGMVFGKKATDQALSMSLSQETKDIILGARVYVEGRGFRIDIHNSEFLDDIKRLIDVKISN